MEGLLNGNLLSKASIFGSSGGSSVKSIQRGSHTMFGYNSPLTNIITISGVDISSSIIIIYFNSKASNTSLSAVMAEIINSTTIKFTGCVGGSTVYPFEWQVVEFNNVKSKQSGIGAYVSSDETFTISSVNTSKSLIFGSFWTCYADTNIYAASYKIISSTSIGIYRRNAGGPQQAAWQVIEFK